jgi:hypothetical protein
VGYVYTPIVAGSHGGSAHTSRLVKRLLDAGATSEWSAKPFEPRNSVETRALERAIKAGMIRRTDGGTYWVDQERYAQCRTKQIRFAIIAAMGMLLLFAILFILGEFP